MPFPIESDRQPKSRPNLPVTAQTLVVSHSFAYRRQKYTQCLKALWKTGDNRAGYRVQFVVTVIATLPGHTGLGSDR